MKARGSARSGYPLGAGVAVLFAAVLLVVMVNTASWPKATQGVVVSEMAVTATNDAGRASAGATEHTLADKQPKLISQGEAEALVQSDVRGTLAEVVSFPMMASRLTTIGRYREISQSGDNQSDALDPIWVVVFSVTGDWVGESDLGASDAASDVYHGAADGMRFAPDGSTRGLWVLDAETGHILVTSVHAPDDSVELDQILALPTLSPGSSDGSRVQDLAEARSSGLPRGPSSASTPIPISAEGTRQYYFPPLATPDPNVSEAARLEHLRQARPHFICTADEAVAFVQEVTHTTDWVRYVAKRTSLIQLDRWQAGEAPADPATENTPLVWIVGFEARSKLDQASAYGWLPGEHAGDLSTPFMRMVVSEDKQVISSSIEEAEVTRDGRPLFPFRGFESFPDLPSQVESQEPYFRGLCALPSGIGR